MYHPIKYHHVRSKPWPPRCSLHQSGWHWHLVWLHTSITLPLLNSHHLSQLNLLLHHLFAHNLISAQSQNINFSMIMMMMMGSNTKPLVHLSLLILVLFSSSTESLRFELQSGHTKCISEDIKSNSMTVGKYQIVNSNEGQPLPDSHRVTVRVLQQQKNNKNWNFLLPSIESDRVLWFLVNGSFFFVSFVWG